ncbi:MAG: YajQ family cyclic di-GMP-binding protein [Deltaproteobacteria bacterium]|nr:YajQ family cyclic di-GMP-binding protein [Deltaproteobacteria bacterium]
MPSFDIVSKVDTQEVDNAVNQAKKEMSQRYDFKGTKSEIEWDGEEAITLIGDDDYKLKAVTDMLQDKLVKRKISLKALDYGKIEDAAGDTKKQKITIVQGIAADKAKAIVKHIKDKKLKVQAQIQGDQLRVTGKKIDDLQTVIAALKEKSFDLDLQFENMRD